MFIGMTTVDLENILSGLLALPAETEVVEFKKAENGFGEHELGQYFSALSNEANLRGIQCAWLVFGVENRTHEVTGTNYKKSRASLDAVKKTIADQTTGQTVIYSRHKGLQNKACEELLLVSLKDHKTLSKTQITELLWPALPDMLNDEQKKNKIRNLLSKLKKQKKIANDTRGNNSIWRLKVKI